MRVPEASGDIEPEILAVLNDILTQSHVVDTPLLEGLLEQQRLQERVQFLSHILQQDGCSKLDAVLQCASVVRIREFDD